MLSRIDQRSLFTLCALITLFSFNTVSLAEPTAPAKTITREPLSIQTQVRLTHAHELLGGSYRKSVVRKSEDTKDITDFVKETTKKFLAKKYKSAAEKVARQILESAKKYELDPVFLMAIIQYESSFNPTRMGGMGEIGLMQIKPATAEWISDLYNLDYKDSKTLLEPVNNIKIGAALVDKLRHQFESESRLYLSAYNVGAKKLRTLVSNKITPKVYVIAVMRRYIAMYSAFKEEGNWKKRGAIAFKNTAKLTLHKAHF